MPPEFSIITPSFNSSKNIHQCLESVRIQQLSDYEHIIIDGASQDSTVEILSADNSGKVEYLSEPDNGIYDAMNKGILMSSGEVVGILNSDDHYVDGRVLSSIHKVFEDTKIDALYADINYVDTNDVEKVIRSWKAGSYNYKKFYWGWMPPHPSFFVRRSFYEKFGLYRLDLGTSADYELMIRFLLKHKLNAVYLPQTVVSMLSGGVSNRSLKNRLAANRMDRLAWKVNDLRPVPFGTFLKPIRKINQWFI